MREIRVNKKYDNKKLNIFLLDSFNNLSPNNLYKALRKKDVRINNVKVSTNETIHEGDIIAIYLTDDLLYGNSINYSIVFEDDNILIVNKPSGISILEDKNNEITLTQILSQKYNIPIYPCHRLDRNTSGIIVFAKNKDSEKILMEKFKSKEIEKKYVCVVSGILKEKHKLLDSYLFKDNKSSTVYVSDKPKKGYLNILTEYTVLNENISKNISLLDISLKTGRTHQIRAHLSHINHPIIGDGKYGFNDVNKLFKKNTQMLCSYYLKFNFESDSGILNYLKGKEFFIDYNDFLNFIK